MQQDNNHESVRARGRFGLRALAIRMPWLLPFCAGVAVGVLLLSLVGLVWMAREGSLSADHPTPAAAAEPPAQPAVPGAARSASATIFMWWDDKGVLRRTGVDAA